jgi:hypothetical protein
MLALDAQQGDVAIRTDLNKSFILATNSPTTLADWKELLTPTDAVLSVAGLTGAISASGLRSALTLGTTDAATLGTLALGGATIGTNSLAVTGTAAISGNLTVDTASWNAATHVIDTRGASSYIYSGLSTAVMGSTGSSGLAGFATSNGGGYGWTASGGAQGGTIDLVLLRGGAGVLAQYNGANAQQYWLFNTRTDLEFNWTRSPHNRGAIFRNGQRNQSNLAAWLQCKCLYWRKHGDWHSSMAMGSERALLPTGQ